MSYGIDFFGPMQVFDKVVDKYMSRYGFDIQIEYLTPASDYDTESGTIIEVKELVNARAMMFDMTLQSNGTGNFRSTLIEAGDKQLFIRPISKNTDVQAVTLTTITPARDRIVIGGDKYKVVTFKEVNPSTTNSSLWELYIRK